MQLSSPDRGILGNPEQFAWYLGRASGFFALLLLFGIATLGLVMHSCFLKTMTGDNHLFEAYRLMVWLAAVAVALRFISFLFDEYLHFNFIEILVPFALSREFPTPLGFDIGKAAAPGIIVFYLLLFVALLLGWRETLVPKIWKRLHAVSLITFFLFVFHQFMFGIESREWWMRAIYGASVSIVFFLILIRIVLCVLLPRWRAWRQAVGAVIPPDDTH